MFERIGLIGKRNDPRVDYTLGELTDLLLARNKQVWIESGIGTRLARAGAAVVEMDELGRQVQLVIIVGGDGTFLGAARSLVGQPVRLVGINMGRLGFLTDVAPEHLSATIDQILMGSYSEERRFLLNTHVYRNGERVLNTVALNDVVAHKWHIARLLELDAYVNASLLYRQRADGLIVATPTGSTAYALSSGGPILHPSLDVLALVPICPHTLSSRPIVVHGDSDVEIVIGDGEQPEAQLTCDGQTNLALLPGDKICIKKHPKELVLLHPERHDYYVTLRDKLNWGWAH